MVGNASTARSIGFEIRLVARDDEASLARLRVLEHAEYVRQVLENDVRVRDRVARPRERGDALVGDDADPDEQHERKCEARRYLFPERPHGHRSLPGLAIAALSSIVFVNDARAMTPRRALPVCSISRTWVRPGWPAGRTSERGTSR